MKKSIRRFATGIAAGSALLFFCFILQSAAAQDTASTPFLNTNLSPEERATDLVHRMTLEEKSTQMQNNSARHSAAEYSRLPMVE